MKKVIIFTSDGGGGHAAVTQALEKYFANSYQVVAVNIIRVILRPIDPIYILTFGKHTVEDFYNYFVPRKQFLILHIIFVTGRLCLGLRVVHNIIQNLFYTYLQKENPDLIISVFPFINNSIMHAAQKCDIPFLLIPTDLDLTTFFDNMQAPYYKKFHLALSFDDREIHNIVTSFNIPKDQTTITGLPLRPDFFSKKRYYCHQKNI